VRAFGLSLVLVFLVTVLVAGCATARPSYCRDRFGRFTRCPEIRTPVGYAYEDGVFYCRDKDGVEWPSEGECD
jgi:hypothetical protein